LGCRTFPFRTEFVIQNPREGSRIEDFRRTIPVSRRRESQTATRSDSTTPQTPEAAGLSDIVFDPTNIEAMEQRLDELRARHRELDETIAQLKVDGGDDIRIMGLKREKLRVKDGIMWLSSKLTPDIIA
jgi:hypothetical protein